MANDPYTPTSVLSRAAPARPALAPARSEITRYRRFHGYDYSRGAAMFLTFALVPRRPLFGSVDTDHVVYSPAGKIALDVIVRESRRDPLVQLRRFVVMPDHIHLRLWLAPGHPEPLRAIGRFVYNVKAWTRNRCKRDLGLILAWEENYHDRLVELGRPILRASPKPLVSVYRPVREEPSLFAAGRYLLLSRVAAPGVAAGVAWHGLNDALGQIALASGGTSVYVQPDATGGVRWEFAR